MKARTVYTVLEETAAKFPREAALHQPLGGGKYRTWTWAEYRDTVQQIAVGVRELVPKGSMVALASETRAEFYLTASDLAFGEVTGSRNLDLRALSVGQGSAS